MATTSPDGRTLTVKGNPRGLAGPWLFMLWVTTPDTRFRVHTGTRGGQESVLINSDGAGRMRVREAKQGRTRLLSIEDAEQGGTTLVWQGNFHELSTFVHGTGVPLETLPKMVGGLRIEDTPGGMLVSAQRGSGVSVRYELGGNFINGLASVTVKPLSSATEQVPLYGGQAVRGGRLWRDDELADDGTLRKRTAVLANDSAATFLVPFDPYDREFAELARTVEFVLS